MVHRQVGSRVWRMKRCLFVALLVMGFCITAQQPVNATVSASPPKPAATETGELLDYHLITPDDGWLLLNNRLYWTSDGGLIWRDATPLTEQPSQWRAVTFLNAQTGWAISTSVDASGSTLFVLARTQDAGNTWRASRLSLFEQGDIDALASAVYTQFIDEHTGWIVVKRATSSNFNIGTLFQTHDGGATWTRLAIPFGEPVYFNSPDNGWIGAGASGEGLFRTRDGGQTWTPATPSEQSSPALQSPASRRLKRRLNGATVSAGSLPNPGADEALSQGMTDLDMATSQVGWARKTSGSCIPSMASGTGRALSTQADKQCVLTNGLYKTLDGGLTWSALSLPGVDASVMSPAFIGSGLDACEVPTLSQLQTWWTNSPYHSVNLYIGGALRACSNAALTHTYVSQMSAQGWSFIPTWVGPQTSCYNSSYSNFISNDPSTAYNQGISEANAATTIATALGMGHTVIYYDLEAYTATQVCRDAARSFMSGWSLQLRTLGFSAGVYGSPCTSYITDFVSSTNVPDVVWPAVWAYSAYSANASVFGLICMDDTLWSNHQRIRQYAGGHDETWGGVTLNIDSNVIDGVVAHYSQDNCANITSRIQLWNQINCAGTSTITNTIGYRNLASTYDNLARSIAIPSGWSVKLFKNTGVTGPSVCIPSSAPDLGAYNYSDSTSASQSASSMYVYSQSNCPVMLNPPSTPTAPSPASNALLSRTSDITLTWSTDAMTCDVHVFGAGINITQSSDNCANYHLGTLYGGSYQWQVTAHHVNSATVGPLWPFSVRPHAPVELTATLTLPIILYAAVPVIEVRGAPASTGVPQSQAVTAASLQTALRWGLSADDPAHVNGYRVYSGNGISITTVPSASTGTNITSIACGSTYSYYVTAISQGVDSLPTKVVTVTTPACNAVTSLYAWTANSEGATTGVFDAGDAIQYRGITYNTTGIAQTAHLTWTITGTCGYLSQWNSDISVAREAQLWYVGGWIPEEACSGIYTLQFIVSFNGVTTVKSIPFTIRWRSFVPLVLK